MNDAKPNMITILGPTASGKTNVACALAAICDGEIISADSRQVYVGMDIGTGKDIDEYQVAGTPIPYHLIDIKPAGFKYNIADFQKDFIQAFHDIIQRQKLPILCGGSGLYIEAALRGNSFLGIPSVPERLKELEKLDTEVLLSMFNELSPRVKSSLDSGTKRRIIRAIIVDEYLKAHPDFKTIEIPVFNNIIFGIDIDRELRRSKITNRLKVRLDNGLIEEVERLLDEGLSYADLDYYGLEYKWIGQYLQGDIDRQELFRGLNIAIHQFAKRQMTWFRRMEKNGYQINWIDAAAGVEEKRDQILAIYKQQSPLKS